MAATQGSPGQPDAMDPIDRESSEVQAVACFFPPTDFLNYGGEGVSGVGEGPLKPLQAAFGARADTPDGKQMLGQEISPIYFVSTALPPTLIIHGDADDVVPLQQSESFLQRATNAGAKKVEVIVRPGKKHGWPEGSIVWKSEEDVRDLVEWFDEHLRGK